MQLAEAVERNEGPDAAAAAIAQVGADVGGRMEDEYRRVEGIVGDLDSAQIADLYVRLKAALDGDFYVIEADAERIVLGSRACPFGEVVRRAPGLCRMTSSVFGGIAARNTGGASVVLEERIALGDPECRVVVWLRGARRGRVGRRARVRRRAAGGGARSRVIAARRYAAASRRSSRWALSPSPSRSRCSPSAGSRPVSSRIRSSRYATVWRWAKIRAAVAFMLPFSSR